MNDWQGAFDAPLEEKFDTKISLFAEESNPTKFTYIITKGSFALSKTPFNIGVFSSGGQKGKNSPEQFFN